MNFIFRTDSSSEIGHGHLMRCLVLAHELKLHQASIHFICRDHSGSAHNLVIEAGYSLHLLPGKNITTKSKTHKDWLGCTQAEDAEACSQILENLSQCHVIVDHYGLDIEWESRIKHAIVTVIDDLADRHHQCIRVIDQSLAHTKKDYSDLIRGDFDFWGGANILLRDEFRKTADWKGPHDGSLMLCMGGADPQGVTNRIVKALLIWLKMFPTQQLIKRLDVVIGHAFDHQEELDKYLDRLPFEVALHRGHPNISALMINSNASILSCGTMILEACALGVPTIGVPLAQNQKYTASFLAARKAIFRLDIDNKMEENLIRKIESALGEQNTPLIISQNAKMMVDKNSAYSIARALTNDH